MKTGKLRMNGWTCGHCNVFLPFNVETCNGRGKHPTSVRPPLPEGKDGLTAPLSLLKQIAKGARGGKCNRTACPNMGANWFSKVMQAWYCQPCAFAINAALPAGHTHLTRDDAVERPHV